MPLHSTSTCEIGTRVVFRSQNGRPGSASVSRGVEIQRGKWRFFWGKPVEKGNIPRTVWANEYFKKKCEEGRSGLYLLLSCWIGSPPTNHKPARSQPGGSISW